MARHERIDFSSKPLNEYICSAKHFQSATKCESFIKKFVSLKPYLAQYPNDSRHSVWYVGFIHKEEPYILNLNIRPAHFQLEFRHPQFIPKEIALKLKVNQNWLCANSNKFSETNLQEMLRVYINSIQESFDRDQIKYVKWHSRKTN